MLTIAAVTCSMTFHGGGKRQDVISFLEPAAAVDWAPPHKIIPLVCANMGVHIPQDALITAPSGVTTLGSRQATEFGVGQSHWARNDDKRSSVQGAEATCPHAAWPYRSGHVGTWLHERIAGPTRARWAGHDSERVNDFETAQC